MPHWRNCRLWSLLFRARRRECWLSLQRAVPWVCIRPLRQGNARIVIIVSTKEVRLKRKMLAASLLLWMFSLTAQADCAVLGPGEDPCAGPVLGPTVCECP